MKKTAGIFYCRKSEKSADGKKKSKRVRNAC